MIKKLFLLIIVILCISCEKEEITYPSFSTLLDEINYYRTNGVQCENIYYSPCASLEWSSELEMIASYQSKYMSDSSDLSHIWKDGTTLQHRLDKFNYTYHAAGENIASGCFSDNVIQAWISNPGHCENVMRTKYNYVAVAEVNGYWTMVLTDK